MNLLLNGLITGAVFAIAASGLVVTYSTSGLFNFAHGALGMLCAYVYWDLSVNDHHHWPLLPKGAWPAPLALAVVVLVVAPLMGAFLHLVVMRGLRDAPEMVKLVVPISVLLGAIGLANWVWKPDRPHSIAPFFGADHRVTVFGVVLLWHDVTILLVALVLALALRGLLYRSRTGVSMRAVVDNRALVELNGARPNRMSLVSWMIGVSLSALAGILITPFNGGSLSSTLLTLLVINAFAAAMFGRLRSLPLTFVGAIVLGLATRLAFQRPSGIMPKSFDWGGNFRLAVPMILLFIVLLVAPQDRLRGVTALQSRPLTTLPSVRVAALAGGAFVVVVLGLAQIMAASPLVTLSEAIAAGIIMLSLVLLVGHGGEVTLATMALAGIAGVVLYHHVGHDVTSRIGLGAIALASVTSALVGAAVAVPALRLRGLYLTLATAAFSIAVEQLLFKEYSTSRRIYPAVLIFLTVIAIATVRQALRRHGWRGAAIALVGATLVMSAAATNRWLSDVRWSPLFPNGNLRIPRPRLVGIDFKAQGRYVILLAIVFAILGVGLVALRHSAYGRRLTAVKNSPAACATLGINIARMRLSVYMIAGGVAGLGGCLYAAQIGAVTADRFGLFESMTMLMLLVVAGAGYIAGGMTAGLLYSAVFVALRGTLNKLGQEFDVLHGASVWLVHFTALLPALIGIGLGRNPNGFLQEEFVRFRSFVTGHRPVAIAAGLVAVAAWAAAWGGVIGNWTFVAVLAVLAVVPRAVLRPRRQHPAIDSEPPLEFVGLAAPFTAIDATRIDRLLGIGDAGALQ